jgi:2-polyprenyl-3-methyl-5-hydroxy-6-metoxy-1,4-benzoquinol methylase
MPLKENHPMTIHKDPEGNETETLHALVNYQGLNVLEIGCGEGRLTWRYADRAAHVTGIDPDREAVEVARANLPEGLEGRVDFVAATLEDYARSNHDQKFDVAIFAWSL